MALGVEGRSWRGLRARIHWWLARTILVAALLAGGLVYAEDEPIERRVRQLEEKLEDHERLKQEVDDLKRQLHDRNESEPAVVSKERSPAAEARSPFFLRVGHGTAELGGLLQVWALHSALDPDDFRLRRSEIKLSGTIIDPIGYTVMIDPAKNLSENKTIIVAGDPVTLSQPRSDGKILQDLFLSLRFVPRHVVDVGQRKIPVSMEGVEASGKLDFAERAIVSGATFRGVRGVGDLRDPGVQITGQWPYLTYIVGVFNGEGPNTSDKNDRKDIAERVILKPWPWLHLGGSRYDGWFGKEKERRNRTGAEFKLDYHDAFLKGEFIRAHDGSIRKEGWYCSAGYRLRDLRLAGISFDLQPVARYEGFDPDLDAAHGSISGPTVGFNLLFDDYYSKMQLDYTRYSIAGQDEDLLIAAFQVAL